MFDPNKPNNSLIMLPSDFEYDQKEILKATIKANNEISKLNWLSVLLPNAELLVSPLLIKESVDSNAIENINTTTLKVLQAEATWIEKMIWPEKEVLFYRKALFEGIEKMNDFNWIPTKLIIEIQNILEPKKWWIRRIPVCIKKWEKIVYTPPEGENLINDLLSNLEKFINNHQDDIDPLIKVAVLHYQFESIHPFSDWNWRTWRILMILYLILTKKLEYPVLFLSEYINNTRTQYYKLLNQTNKTDNYKDFILYILEAIRFQAIISQNKISSIKNLMDETQSKIINIWNLDYHKIVRILFSYPYITISDFGKLLGISRQTTTRYISKLQAWNVINILKIWRTSLVYIPEFIKILS